MAGRDLSISWLLVLSFLFFSSTIPIRVYLSCRAPNLPPCLNTPAGSARANTSVILLIGDGMGFAHAELGRLVEYGPDGNSSISLFPYNTSVSTTNVNGEITDSAAGGTAIATGVLTQNGRISMTGDGENLTTILEIAQEHGYATGIITTCQLAHATPAVFAAHQPDRNMYLEIARDMVSHDVDLLLGGGHDNAYLGTFIDELQSRGYHYCTNKSSLSLVHATPVIGLFSGGHLPRAQDYTSNTSVPTLLEMVEKGISLLNSTGKPFFLMIEGSAIDWGAHANDKVYVAHEMIEFEKVINHTVNLALNMPNLQVLLTADHETGGLEVLGYNITTPAPLETDSLEMKIQKRTARTNEVTVSWATGDHTNLSVIFAGIGPYSNFIANSTSNTDIFDVIHSAIENVDDTGPNGKNESPFTIVQVYIAVITTIGMSLTCVFLYAKNQIQKARM